MLNSANTSRKKRNADHGEIVAFKSSVEGAPALNARRQTNRLAYLVVDGQAHGFHCNLQQINSSSAQFTVSGLMGIPDRFSLYVEPDKVRYDCSVTMKKGNAVRVRFDGVEENVRFRDAARQR